MIALMTSSLQTYRRTLFQTCATLAVLVAGALLPLISWADDPTEVDARLEGYYPSVILKDASGVGMTIVFLIALIGITMGVMFINAHRSHLD